MGLMGKWLEGRVDQTDPGARGTAAVTTAAYRLSGEDGRSAPLGAIVVKL